MILLCRIKSASTAKSPDSGGKSPCCGAPEAATTACKLSCQRQHPRLSVRGQKANIRVRRFAQRSRLTFRTCLSRFPHENAYRKQRQARKKQADLFLQPRTQEKQNYPSANVQATIIRP